MYNITDNAYNLLRRDVLRILDGCAHIPTESADAHFHKSIDYVADSCENPHKFFNFQFRKYYTFVRRVGLQYTVYSRAWKPNLVPFNATIETFAGCYGIFDDLECAVNAWRSVVNDIFDFCLNSEVEFRQLEIF